ncbi:hypothetical protein LTR36_009048 [Oleoguttula mirabilis]|uniref:RRM domain-containing protein n=1 Tax=Oleoguttula mirabilis TaxID=1507867 RepID=A0AAV9J7A1_9PEZI|nr:hypothetical protein LTR36_009048 [Oleoguttula mirabilis]
MSQETASNRKEKKAVRDAERQKQRQGKKRKHDETVDGAEHEQEDAELKKDSTPLDTKESATSGEAVAVKTPKSKKRKQTEDGAPEAASVEAAVDGTAPKPKKRRKAAQDAVDSPSEAVDAAVDGAAPKPKKRKKAAKDAVDTPGEAAEASETTAATKPPRGNRFVCFIGNLPYNTTDASLQAHFQKLMPFTLRHRTDPKTKKSKGFAFLEFENYDRMGTCLKQFHHSMFDPADHAAQQGGVAAGKGQGRGGRQINVELTAGGGGKKEGRMEKIKVKNVRLEEQRTRRLEQERKEKTRSDRKDGSAKKEQSGKQEDAQEGAAEGDNAGVHPSRLAMLKR